MNHSNLQVLSKYGNGDFTNSQLRALSELEKFATDDRKVLTLEGQAGTGKTYIVKYFLDNIYNKPVCVTAPTHKAVRVIEKATGRKGLTFHSLHGLRPNTDIANFNINNPQFDPLAEAKISNYRLVIVDECSQINKGLDILNKNRAELYNTKILYIGDSFQLPPINETMSNTFNGNIIKLTEVVRQSEDNILLKLFPILRNDISTGNTNFVKAIFENQNGLNDKKEGYLLLNKDNFDELLNIKFSNNKLNNRFLAFTNDTVNKYNYFIRSLLNNSSNILTKVDNTTAYKTIFDEFLTPTITNSTDYIIRKIVNRTNDQNMNVYFVDFVSEFGEISNTVQIINHRDIDTYKRYIRLLSKLHYNAMTAMAGRRREAWKEYYNYKNSILSMVNIPLEYKGIEVDKDLSYSYGLTIHKSQGSTYDNVFVPIKDIYYNKYGNRVPDIKFANKLLYVALSRAAKQAIILT